MKYWLLLLLATSVLAGCSEDLQPENVTPPATPATDEDETEAAVKDVEATPVSFNTEGAPTVSFNVPDMMCEHSCVPTVRETLAEQPGVKDVKVELDGKKATVAVDTATFDADAAVAALVDLQFTNTKLLPSAATTP